MDRKCDIDNCLFCDYKLIGDKKQDVCIRCKNNFIVSYDHKEKTFECAKNRKDQNLKDLNCKA